MKSILFLFVQALVVCCIPIQTHADTFTNKTTGEVVKGKVMAATMKDGQRVYLVRGEDGQQRQLSQEEWERKWDGAGPVGPVADETKMEAGGKLAFAGKVTTGVGATAEEALKNALVSVVEQAVGVLVIARTKVVDEVVEEKIITATNAYVDRYEILKQWQEQGVCNCRIVAHVCGRKLKMDLEANKVATRPLEGKDLAAWMETEERAKQNAAEVLKDCLEDLPNKLLTIKATGSPLPVGSSLLRIPIEIAVDMGKYKQAVGEIKYKVGKIARLKATGVARYLPGKYPSYYQFFNAYDLQSIDKSPVSPHPGELIPKIWYDETGDWRASASEQRKAIIKGLVKEATRKGQRLAFLMLMTDISADGAAELAVYGLDEEAIQYLGKTGYDYQGYLVIKVALADGTGKETASKEATFSGVPGWPSLVFSSSAYYDDGEWRIVGVSPGWRDCRGLAPSLYGYAYVDATTDQLMQAKNVNVTVRWKPWRD